MEKHSINKRSTNTDPNTSKNTRAVARILESPPAEPHLIKIIIDEPQTKIHEMSFVFKQNNKIAHCIYSPCDVLNVVS